MFLIKKKLYHPVKQLQSRNKINDKNIKKKTTNCVTSFLIFLSLITFFLCCDSSQDNIIFLCLKNDYVFMK